MAEQALATTFYDDETMTVEIMTPPSSTGLCRVRMNDGAGSYMTIARHVDRLTPINDAAKELLKK